MIFKLQKSLSPKGKVLIYDEKHTYQGELPLTPHVDMLFDGRNKLYAHGYIDRRGMLHIEDEAEEQPW